MVGRHNQRTPARASQQDRLVFQATILEPGLPPLRGLSLLSEKRRLSEAVYLETDKDGDDWSDAMVHGRSSEGVEWELDIEWLANWRNPRIHTTPLRKKGERDSGSNWH